MRAVGPLAPAAAVLLLSIGACSQPAASAEPPATTSSPRSVSTTATDAGSSDVPPGQAPLTVRRGELRQKLVISGELAAVNRQSVLVPRTPEYETTIRWIIDEGTMVEAGDTVVELDTSQVASQLTDKELALQSAQDELISKEAEVDRETAEKELALEDARIQLEKAEIDAAIPREVQSQRQFEDRQLALQRAMVEHEKAITDLEGYEESAQSELEVLRIEMAQAQREVEEAQRAIDTMVLRAPKDGMVVVSENYREDRKFQEGDMAYVGAEIFSIPDLSAMMVDAHLSDVDDGKIVPGMRAIAYLDAYPELPIPGVIRSISVVAHEAGPRSMQRYFRVVVDLELADTERMLPGMSARAEVETAHLADALLIPRSALVFEDDGVRALLERGVEQAVTLGSCNAFECVVEDGPPEGTRLRAAR